MITEKSPNIDQSASVVGVVLWMVPNKTPMNSRPKITRRMDLRISMLV